jgi:phage shock protein E
MMKTLLAAIAALCLAACSRSESPSPAPKPASTSKDPEAARKLLAEGAIAIDVRTPDEYAGEHLPSAANVPVDQLAERMGEIDKLTGGDKGRPIVLYCGTGKRAANAKAQLDAAGYTNVVNGGGLNDLR